MITFAWTPSSFWNPPFPLVEGNGGTESYTLGQSRELTRRGIENQVVTFRLGKQDGRDSAPDVPFVDYPTLADAKKLPGTVILTTEPADIDTVETPYVMIHNSPLVERNKTFYQKGYANRKLLTNSKFSAKVWADYLGIDVRTIGVVYPFAAGAFGSQPMPKRPDGPTRVLFAGRLSVEKGFYTFLEALHLFKDDPTISFTVVEAGSQGSEFALIKTLAQAHPMLTLVPARHTPQDMAALLVTQDIVVMPSHSVMWREPFGMLSVEAQHAGCRVVASHLGGLPETDCGGLYTFEPDNPIALADTIRKAAALGRLNAAERKKAAGHFTVTQSVDQLLAAIAANLPVYRG